MTDARRTDAATRIQSVERGRRARRRGRLHSLAARVERHYRTRAASLAAATTSAHVASGGGSGSGPGADGILLSGAVMQLKDRLLKLSGLVWQMRSVHVDDFKFMYTSRQGETKSIDLVDIDRLSVVSEDRFEFAIWARSGKHHTFRATSREQFLNWTRGVPRYVGMACAYYAL